MPNKPRRLVIVDQIGVSVALTFRRAATWATSTSVATGIASYCTGVVCAWMLISILFWADPVLSTGPPHWTAKAIRLVFAPQEHLLALRICANISCWILILGIVVLISNSLRRRKAPHTKPLRCLACSCALIDLSRPVCPNCGILIGEPRANVISTEHSRDNRHAGHHSPFRLIARLVAPYFVGLAVAACTSCIGVSLSPSGYLATSADWLDLKSMYCIWNDLAASKGITLGPRFTTGFVVIFMMWSPSIVASLCTSSIFAWRAHSAHSAIQCPDCGYILRGLSQPRCPECGYKI